MRRIRLPSRLRAEVSTLEFRLKTTYLCPIPRASTVETVLVYARQARSCSRANTKCATPARSEEHTSELQSLTHLVCRLLLEKKKKKIRCITPPLAPGTSLAQPEVEQDDRCPSSKSRDRRRLRTRKSQRQHTRPRRPRTRGTS